MTPRMKMNICCPGGAAVGVQTFGRPAPPPPEQQKLGSFHATHTGRHLAAPLKCKCFYGTSLHLGTV